MFFRAIGPSGLRFTVDFAAESAFGFGPTQEFFTLVSQKYAALNDCSAEGGNRLWRGNNKSELFPSAAADPDLLYEVGILCAMSLLMEYPICLDFNPAFFVMVFGHPVRVSDVDEEMADSLTCLDDLLGLTFSCPRTKCEIIEDGAQKEITKENVEVFVKLMEDFICGSKIQPQIDAWVRGFSEVMDPTILRMFSPIEITQLISGSPTDFTREELKRYVKVEGFAESQELLEDFFDVLVEMSENEKIQFLRFSTGSPKLPAGGLANLITPLVVRLVALKQKNVDLVLPSALTCKGILKLPAYSSKEVMKNKLLFAIQEGVSWFGFS
jgi:E3 ubiquitin-protein ligase TRIP12